MQLETWLLYVGTVLIFMLVPGPSHILMLSVSLANGMPRSLATAAGDLSANLLQMCLAALGLAVVITSTRHGLQVVKWAGVAYLAWVGLRQILSSLGRHGRPAMQAVPSLARLWLRGFVTSAANPKAVVFFAALFPQFLSVDQPVGAQLAILAATYVFIDGAFLLGYGLAAHAAAAALDGRGKALVDRIAGTGMIAAAVMLGLRAAPR